MIHAEQGTFLRCSYFYQRLFNEQLVLRCVESSGQVELDAAESGDAGEVHGDDFKLAFFGEQSRLWFFIAESRLDVTHDVDNDKIFRDILRVVLFLKRFLLLCFLLVEVDGDTPTPVEVLVLNSHESADV